MFRVYSLGSPYGCAPCEHLARGVRGRFYPDPNKSFETDPIAVWGQLRGAKELLARSRTFYRMDHAYVGRLAYFRITKGDFQPGWIVNRPADRWERLKKQFSLAVGDWKSGGHVLVALSDPKTYAFFGNDYFPEKIVSEIEKYTDRPIKVRPRKADRPIREDLAGAHCLVTYASNSAIDALMLGVPVFTLGPSIARPMGYKDVSRIEEPLYPENREEFFRHVAYSQFTNEEFASGFALKTADEQDTERVRDGDLNLCRATDGGKQLARS